MNSIEKEISEIVRCIESKWGVDKIKNPNGLVDYCKDLAFHDARAFIDSLEVFRKLEEVERVYGRYSSDPEAIIFSYVNDHSNNFQEAAQTLDCSKWDFSRMASRAKQQVISKFELDSTIRPLGWADLEKNYVDFDGQEEYCNTQLKVDREDFRIERFNSRTHSFYSAISLPYVMYECMGQGRSPRDTLISSIYSHFLQFREKMNTEKLLEDIKSVALSIKESGSFDIKSLGPHSKVIFKGFDLKSKIEENESMRKWKETEATEAPSKEEIKKRAEIAKRIIDEIISEQSLECDERKREAEIEEIRKSLRESLDQPQTSFLRKKFNK